MKQAAPLLITVPCFPLLLEYIYVTQRCSLCSAAGNGDMTSLNHRACTKSHTLANGCTSHRFPSLLWFNCFSNYPPFRGSPIHCLYPIADRGSSVQHKHKPHPNSPYNHLLGKCILTTLFSIIWFDINQTQNPACPIYYILFLQKEEGWNNSSTFSRPQTEQSQLYFVSTECGFFVLKGNFHLSLYRLPLGWSPPHVSRYLNVNSILVR